MFVAPVMAQQTLTFTNSTPTVTVPLLSGSNVGIQTNGSMTAQCQLDATNKCVGLPSGPGSNPPVVSIAASGFSTAADGTGKYSSGTTFTLTPSVSNGDVCTRLIGSGTPSGTGWTGTAVSPFSGTVVTLNAANTTFSFSLKCYGDGGNATSAVYTVATNNGTTPPPAGDDQCTESIAPPSGFTVDTQYTTLQQLPLVSGGTLQPFPNTGGGLGQWGVQRSRFSSLKFTVPTDPNAFTGLLRQFSWQEGQQVGEAHLARTYITISQCKGDFRAPVDSADAPSTDMTFALGCRNLRPGASSQLTRLSYTVTPAGIPSTGTMCNLKAGNTYYLNMIMASPLDGGGIVAGETSCKNSAAARCGVQIQAN